MEASPPGRPWAGSTAMRCFYHLFRRILARLDRGCTIRLRSSGCQRYQRTSNALHIQSCRFSTQHMFPWLHSSRRRRRFLCKAFLSTPDKIARLVYCFPPVRTRRTSIRRMRLQSTKAPAVAFDEPRPQPSQALFRGENIFTAGACALRRTRHMFSALSGSIVPPARLPNSPP